MPKYNLNHDVIDVIVDVWQCFRIFQKLASLSEHVVLLLKFKEIVCQGHLCFILIFEDLFSTDKDFIPPPKKKMLQKNSVLSIFPCNFF